MRERSTVDLMHLAAGTTPMIPCAECGKTFKRTDENRRIIVCPDCRCPNCGEYGTHLWSDPCPLPRENTMREATMREVVFTAHVVVEVEDNEGFDNRTTDALSKLHDVISDAGFPNVTCSIENE